MTQSPVSTHRSAVGENEGWRAQLVRWVAILIVANALVDTVIVAPLLVLPQMAEFFGTDQSAWLNASTPLAVLGAGSTTLVSKEKQGVVAAPVQVMLTAFAIATVIAAWISSRAHHAPAA